MGTVRDLIEDSLRLIGVIASGETATASEAADALSLLNDMLESWSLERLVVYSAIRREFPLTAGVGAYTIGPGGDFNVARPIKIEEAAIETQSSAPAIEYPLDILDKNQWARIKAKGLASDIPKALFLDGAYPLATLNLYPVPSAAHNLVIYPWEAITAFASVNDDVEFPPGYRRAIRYNLALELQPEFGGEIPPLVADIAEKSKSNIKRVNSEPGLLVCESALAGRGSFNIYTGDYE